MLAKCLSWKLFSYQEIPAVEWESTIIDMCFIKLYYTAEIEIKHVPGVKEPKVITAFIL